MPEYGVSTFIVVQYLKDFLISEGAVMIDLAKLEPVLGGYQTYFPKHWPHVEDFKWEAAQHFHDHWNIDAADFGEMFKEATAKVFFASGYRLCLSPCDDPEFRSSGL